MSLVISAGILCGHTSHTDTINLPLFSTVVPACVFMFLSCRPFVAITTLSTPTRPVDNVVLATKGLQDRNINTQAGRTVENKGKLILKATNVQSFTYLGLVVSEKNVPKKLTKLTLWGYGLQSPLN